MLIELTVFSMTVHAGIVLFGIGYCMYCRAKDGVSVGCLLLFLSVCLNVLFAFVYDNHMVIGWERTVILPFRLRHVPDTAVLDND